MACLLLLFQGGLAQGQESQYDGAIQRFTGTLAADDGRGYQIRPLAAGDTLYVLLENSAGSLDPFLQLYDADTFELLADDDDSGGGLNASLVYTVQAGQSLYLNLRPSPDALPTAGDFRLTLGVNTPAILTQTLVPKGAIIADFAGAFIASETQQVQEVQGYLTARSNHYYILPSLFAGDDLYIYAESLSGNFDPYIDVSLNGSDEVLASDDDSGAGLDATLQFTIPQDGDYLLLLENCCLQGDGDYRLLIGLNTPTVLTGQATVTGDLIASLDKDLSQLAAAVEEVAGNWASDPLARSFDLAQLNKGDVFYAYLQSSPLEESALPQVRLEDYAGKVLAQASLTPNGEALALSYELLESNDDYRLTIIQPTDEAQTRLLQGDYRLVVGVNVRSVVEGEAAAMGDPIFQRPIPIRIQLEMEQLTELDQANQQFSGVMVLRATWQDPRQAFDPGECECTLQTLTEEALRARLSAETLDWPQFTFPNQQGQRHAHHLSLSITSTGDLTYEERFTATFQASALDLRRYPFDRQRLWVDVITPFSTDTYQFIGVGAGLAQDLGQAEWYVAEYQAQAGFNTANQARYRLDFWLERYSTVYLYRALLPLGLLIWLGWLVFFVEHYILRVLALGGLFGLLMLLNMTITRHLPALPYLTYLEALGSAALLITSLMIFANFYLVWAITSYSSTHAQRVDRALIALYPALYALILGGLSLLFLD
jgi:hypothetical protein